MNWDWGSFLVGCVLGGTIGPLAAFTAYSLWAAYEYRKMF